MKVVAITQARMGSTRLPGKVLKKVGNKELLRIHIERILQSKQIQRLIVATTTEVEDDRIAALASELHITAYRGSVSDVLDRFYQAVRTIEPEWVVRLTSDCPLIDPHLIDQVVITAARANVDYCSNTLVTDFPDGMDVEVIKFSALTKAWNEAKLSSEREHVTPYIYKNSDFMGGSIFKALNYSENLKYGNVRLTVDEEKDLMVIDKLVRTLGTLCGWKEYADVYLKEKTLNELNSHIQRNEGYKED